MNTKFKKLMKNKPFIISMVVINVIVNALFIADFFWKKSGSNEWVLERDKNGIKVWTMKAPDSRLLKYKMVTRVEARLSDAVFYMTDIDTGSDLGAIDLRRIDSIVDSPAVINYDTYKIDFGFPFNMREVVIMNQYRQDPATKVVEMNILAAPNKIPMDGDIKRMLHLSNHWRYTPLENGEVEIQLIANMDLRIPYFMSNMASPDILYETSIQMRDLLKTPKYQNKSPLFVTELESDSLVSN